MLLINDNQDILTSLSTLLEEEGYYVDTANNGEESIQKAREGTYDIALIDIRLPDLEGPGILTELGDTTPEIVKIIITGYSSLRNAIDAINEGAHGYIVEPFEPDELLRIIEHHLRKREKKRRCGQKAVKNAVERVEATEDGENREAINQRLVVGIYSCLFCARSFSAKRQLNRHYIRRHRENIPNYEGMQSVYL